VVNIKMNLARKPLEFPWLKLNGRMDEHNVNVGAATQQWFILKHGANEECRNQTRPFSPGFNFLFSQMDKSVGGDNQRLTPPGEGLAGRVECPGRI
jgi:hypothetical protein